MMTIEKMAVYDAQKHRLPDFQIRGQKMPAGKYRFVVMVVLFDSHHRILIQQHQATKASWPNYWDLGAGGAVQFGEKLYQAAERELFEELGIRVALKNVPSRMTVAFDEGWDEVYFIQKDVPEEEFVLQKEEVKAAKWVTQAELEKLLDQKKFIPYIYARNLFDYDGLSEELN